MNIIPTGNQLLVRRDPEEEVSAGGIIITPGHVKQLPRGRGVVLAVGPGRKHPKTGERIPMETALGDRVVFSKLSGDKVRDDLAQQDVDDDLVLISESEVIAILEATRDSSTVARDMLQHQPGCRDAECDGCR